MQFNPLSFIPLVLITLSGALIDDDVEITGNHIRLGLHPSEGGAIHTFTHILTPGDLAGEAGLLNEGFGIGSHYVPNRRLNEKLEAVETVTDRPVLRYSYDCDGPNITGLSVTRMIEPMPDEASVRLTWTVENKGTERQWISPWILNDVTPGGAANVEDRLDVPSTEGIVSANGARLYVAARNWIAATDPLMKESVYWVFDAEAIHSYMADWQDDGTRRGVKAWFVPRVMEPGAKWTTSYRMNTVRGLTHIDFGSDELAAQLDYKDGKLVLLLAAVRDIPGLQIQARVLAENGRVWKMPDKKFDAGPNRLVRCTYDWEPEADGAYDFLAQVTQNGAQYFLGAGTDSPHGGIDTRFVVGKGTSHAFDPWTNAPYAIERGARMLERAPAATSPALIWFEPAAFKIFQNDDIAPRGGAEPTLRIALARGEHEAAQIVIRPPDGEDWLGVTAQVSDLVSEASGGRIPASEITLSKVHYHDLRFPSHFEGPTGLFPDALPPLDAPFNAPAAQCTPLWLSVHAPRDLAPGEYAGTLTLTSPAREAVSLAVSVRVYDFELPETPRMKTDFGFWLEAAERGAREQGGSGGAKALTSAYLDNAFAHRVTLREPTELPAPQANYAGALAAYKRNLAEWRRQGLTSVSVPSALKDNPALLAEANAFIKNEQLADLAFVHLAHEPQEPVWEQMLAGIQQWQASAPDIPVHISTTGLRPFLPEAIHAWVVHAQMMDTVYNGDILKKIANGGEVWWYVDRTPPRPYANFFVDFQAIEHRILFWQAWALGVKGMYYWGVNFAPEGHDPWNAAYDPTPANGNGLLVYPGADGPINSIRWECIRDGLEDYDYLAMFSEMRRELEAKGGNEALRERAAAAYNMQAVIPNLVEYTRDPKVLMNKREEIAGLIVEMRRALGN